MENHDSKSWALIESTLKDITKEQRISRRWGIVFKSLGLLYLFSFIAVLFIQGDALNDAMEEPHVAMVKIQGVISENEAANANAVATSLRKAFKNEQAKAVMLAINSPGGSPVQSAYMYNEITRLKQQYPDKVVYAVISDIGASGGYYVAAAADYIYANPSSLVGSIGVTAASFGFVGLMDKLGVERRNFTSGEHKSFLDPFAPENPAQVDFWKTVLADTHQQFIDAVENGRGDRLQKDEDLYSGLVWSGNQAKALGLIDGFGSAGQVARDTIGVEEFVDYTVKPDSMARIIEKLGAAIGTGIAMHISPDPSTQWAPQLR